jgi:hypothetical protein
MAHAAVTPPIFVVSEDRDVNSADSVASASWQMEGYDVIAGDVWTVFDATGLRLEATAESGEGPVSIIAVPGRQSEPEVLADHLREYLRHYVPKAQLDASGLTDDELATAGLSRLIHAQQAIERRPRQPTVGSKLKQYLARLAGRHGGDDQT